MSQHLFARATNHSGSTPGPGAYQPTFANKPSSPSFSMKSRHEENSNPLAAPYRSLPSTIGEGPKYTMSSRHAIKEATATPGPNYVPPPLGADSTKSSMHARTGTDKDSRADNPGPGAYDIPRKFANDANKFTLHQRTRDMNEGKDISPGPAAYTPNYSSIKRRAPSPSMHIRPENKSLEVTPGPSDYEIKRDLGGRAATLHIRTEAKSSYTTPGPGAYAPTMANRKSTPAYTIKSRHETISRPITAPYRGLPSTIGQGPKYTMVSRHRTREVTETPGPNYVPPPLGSDAKKSSFHIRGSETRDGRSDNPGPGAYDIPRKFANDANKFTLHQRTHDSNEGQSISPGPAAYTPNYNATRRSAPSPTMHVRTKMNEPEQTPGYVALPSTLSGPSYTIGHRENLDMVEVV